MPEPKSVCWQTDGRVLQFEQFMADGKAHQNKLKISADRVYELIDSPPPKKTRGKPESSKHFGVRFRPDLAKWVAEIRVFEWKTVDKKIWLGTFDSEQGAAHAVDAARKLLKCKKNRPPNCPCDELFVYSETIPASLNLTNLVDESMFKEVTVFVKRKAQEYAAGFSCSLKATAAPPPHSPSLREQLPSLLAPTVALPYQVSDGGQGCFHLTSELESRQLYTVPEDEISPHGNGYTPNSYTESYGSYLSYGTHFPSSYDCAMASNWSSSTSQTHSAPPSCSSAGTSPTDGGWVQVQPEVWNNDDLQFSGDDGWVSLSDPLHESRADHQMPLPEMMNNPATTSAMLDMGSSHALFDDFVNMMDDDPGRQCHVGDQSYMNIILGDEEQEMYVDSQYDSWALQRFNNTYSSASFEYRGDS